MRHEGSGVNAEPTIRARELSPSAESSPRLGWQNRSLLIWALAGWALAALLGILLWVHVTVGRETTPAPPAETMSPEILSPTPIDPPVAVPSPTTTAVAVATVSAVETRREPETSEPDDSALVAAYLRHAAVFTEAGEFDKAIESYERALALDPGNADFVLLRSQVDEMRSFAKRTRVTMALAFREGSTEYVPPAGGRDPRRFSREQSEGVAVRRATEAAEFPGELVVDLRPRNIEPGDPHIMSIRLYNKGNRAIDVESIEVVFRYGGRVHGVGARQAVRVRRVNPRDTALLWEHQDTWREDQVPGGLDVTVHLAGGAQLTKTVSW